MAVTDDPRLGRPHAADVAARTFARRLETILRRPCVGLSHRRPGLQIQPDRHRRGHRHSSACPGRGDARASGRDRPAAFAQQLADVERSSFRPIRPTASTPGTCSPSVCGWNGSRSTVTRSSSGCASGAWAARCIGGRCTCTRITNRLLAGGPAFAGRFGPVAQVDQFAVVSGNARRRVRSGGRGCSRTVRRLCSMKGLFRARSRTKPFVEEAR